MKAIFLRRSILFIFSALFFTAGFSQSIKVTGKITNDQGEGLAGVSIVVKNTKVNSMSSMDGSFTISAPSPTSVLVFSYVGFASQEIVVNNKTEIDVTLVSATASLQDVVVVGYGTVKKSDVTGALSRISAADIQERPAQNLLQAVQGKAAGVTVSSNMKPGELPVLRVRGNRSLGASNEPLYVVDGIPIVNALGVTSFSISDLNPNDIASMEILKDASATAIYGSRGANGVVLITTNKAKKGRTTLGYTATVSLDKYHSMTDWMDGGQYIDRWRLSLMNGRLYQQTTNTNQNNPATMWYPDPFLDRDKMALAADQTALRSVWSGYEWDVYGQTPKTRPTTTEEQAMGWPANVPIYNSQNIRSYDWLECGRSSRCFAKPPAFRYGWYGGL